jgi:hypothetical protein
VVVLLRNNQFFRYEGKFDPKLIGCLLRESASHPQPKPPPSVFKNVNNRIFTKIIVNSKF